MPLLSIAALLLCTAIVAAYAVRVLRSGRVKHARLGDQPGSVLLPGWLVEAFYGALGAPGRSLARLGVDPDTLTYLSLACSLASAPLLATGRLPEGALAIAAGGCLDALDGMVARALGRASPAGAVLDSVVDRLSDAAPLAGLAILYRGHAGTLLGPLAAMTASSLVSYARAKADGYGLSLPNGLMRRHERIAYLLLSLLLGPLAPSLGIAPDVPYPATLAGVVFIAAASFMAALILVERTRAALAPQEPARALPVKPRPHVVRQG